MEDPVLNRVLEETRELHTRWGQFRDFVLMAVKSRRVNAQAEMKFLELKSRIAMLHDGFMQRLKHEQKTGQNIMSIVGDCILLKRCADYSDAEKQKFEFDWNDCYLLLTEQLGALEEEKKRLAGINERAYNMARRREAMTASIHNFLHSTGFKAVIVLAVLGMLLYGIPAMGIYDYKNFGRMNWSKPAYQPFVNYVYRPFISSELPYLEFEEIPRDDELELVSGISNNASRNDELTTNYFRETELTHREGFRLRGANLERVRQAFGNHMVYQTERHTALGQDTRMYHILFRETAQARELVDALRDGVNALPEASRAEVLNQVYVQRRANFVIIGVSQHVHRGFPAARFKFPNPSPSLLNQ